MADCAGFVNRILRDTSVRIRPLALFSSTMNRKLKVRVWDEKYSVWVKDPIFIYPFTDIVKQGHVIQLFTGLIDKNGKEIYEGDLINFSVNHTVCLGDQDIIEWKNQKVFYDEENASFIFGEVYEYTMLDRILEKSLEVVGNIFENPELKAN